MMNKALVGIIGGSGLYEMEGIHNMQEHQIETPFGSPSEVIVTGELADKPVAFLARHGRGHRILPSEINYQANICALKMLGVEYIIAVGACGSLKEELKPGDLVLVDQFFDRTRARGKGTFFGDGIVAHIQFGNPICPNLQGVLYDAACQVGVTVHNGGTYINMEGPQFSTKAESNLYRSWGMDVIGMTNLYEAKLAREAEICYATLAFVTDYDCWHEEEVTIAMVIEYLNRNIVNAKRIIKKSLSSIPYDRNCQCPKALENAIITQKERIPQQTKDKLKVIAGKYL